MKYQAILLAAGSGVRSSLSYNKILYEIGNKPMILIAANNFLADDECEKLIVVYNEKDLNTLQQLFKEYRKVCFVSGGRTRQESTANGLDKVDSEYVLIHDGARPYFSKDLLERIKNKLESVDAVIPALQMTDTIKRVINGVVVETLNRNELFSVQTPQGFKTKIIKEAHNLKNENIEYTDDGMLVEKLTSSKVYVVDGEKENIKYTTKEDFKG